MCNQIDWTGSLEVHYCGQWTPAFYVGMNPKSCKAHVVVTGSGLVLNVAEGFNPYHHQVRQAAQKCFIALYRHNGCIRTMRDTFPCKDSATASFNRRTSGTFLKVIEVTIP